jgi:hypothetical protein
MKLTADRPFADPAVAARKLLEIANATEAAQHGRIYIEKINDQFLNKEGYAEGVQRRAEVRHRSWLAAEARVRTYVKFTAAGADLFA